MKALTLRISDSLWAALRERAYLTQTRYNTLCIKALEEYLRLTSGGTEDGEERREDHD